MQDGWNKYYLLHTLGKIGIKLKMTLILLAAKHMNGFSFIQELSYVARLRVIKMSSEPKSVHLSPPSHHWSLYILAHHNWLTCTKVCFNKIGSKAGSRVSPTSSRRTGIPMRMQFSRVRRKFWSVSLITLSPFLASFARIHRLALKFECRKEIKVSKSAF